MTWTGAPSMVERYPFKNTVDYSALHGFDEFGDPDEAWGAAVTFWMNYAWSAFCLQWVAISWCAVVGDERCEPPSTEARR